jgi:hypothetical protein
VTAFSTSVPPTSLVFGVLQNDATHQIGKMTNPIKKHHACGGDPDPGSPGVPILNDHPVGCFLGGFLGSLMWNVLERPTDGAWGDIKALMGMDTCDMLERGSFSAAFDRVDVARDAAREDGRGWIEGRVLLARLAQEPVLPASAF